MANLQNVFGFILMIFLSINILCFALSNCPWALWRRARQSGLPAREARGDVDTMPFISVHLPIHDEPPEVVIATLQSLRALRYPRFEVIVIDNNTPSRNTWLPVSEYCAQDPRFRFYHFSYVKGAKAGALTLGLALMAPSAAYVAVVDADYQVVPDFLAIAVAECQRHADHFVQFPQAYRQSRLAPAVDRELADYFAVYSSPASSVGAMLPTGTLSLIRADTLRRVGGWPSTSVTEDAEIGMRMWRMGASGRYVNRVVGRGMLPLDLHGLRRQRDRWASGNARTLLSHFSDGLARWPSHGRWAVLAQLTAWMGFGSGAAAGSGGCPRAAGMGRACQLAVAVGRTSCQLHSFGDVVGAGCHGSVSAPAGNAPGKTGAVVDVEFRVVAAVVEQRDPVHANPQGCLWPALWPFNRHQRFADRAADGADLRPTGPYLSGSGTRVVGIHARCFPLC